MLAGVWLLEQPWFPPTFPFPPEPPSSGPPLPRLCWQPPFLPPCVQLLCPQGCRLCLAWPGGPEPGGTSLLSASLPPILAHP